MDNDGLGGSILQSVHILKQLSDYLYIDKNGKQCNEDKLGLLIDDPDGSHNYTQVQALGEYAHQQANSVLDFSRMGAKTSSEAAFWGGVALGVAAVVTIEAPPISGVLAEMSVDAFALATDLKVVELGLTGTEQLSSGRFDLNELTKISADIVLDKTFQVAGAAMKVDATSSVTKSSYDLIKNTATTSIINSLFNNQKAP
jgi:hypothetical protein